MTVDENLQLAAFLRKDKAAIRTDRDRALEFFPRIRERLTQMAGTMVAIEVLRDGKRSTLSLAIVE